MYKMNKNLFVYIIVRLLFIPVLWVLTCILFMILHVGEEILFFFGAIEVLVWLVWLVKDIVRYRKSRQWGRVVVNSVFLTVFIVLALFVYVQLFIGQHMYTEYSPDRKYRIEVYIQPTLFAMPGGGGMGSKTATIILKNSWGWPIGKSNGECEIMYYDVEITWDYPNNQVWFGKARSLDLTTGRCNY